MPIHEYDCKCGNEKEVLHSFKDADQSQICECGKVMQRLMSVSYCIVKPTGKQMALDTLNDRRNGMPNRHWKSSAERFAATGL